MHSHPTPGSDGDYYCDQAICFTESGQTQMEQYDFLLNWDESDHKIKNN